jgi:hypothetical protein
MIYVICGEDSIASRDYFVNLKKNYYQKNYLVIELKEDDFYQLTETEIFSSLFYQNKIFFAENLYQAISKNTKLLDKINQLFMDKNNLYIWENKSKYELKNFTRLKIIEFKLEKNVFILLDNFFPGNKKNFFQLYHQLVNEKKEGLFFYLLAKRVRQLIIIKSGKKPDSIQSWQLKKLKSQAEKWSMDALIRLYQSFFNIEQDIKTSQTPYSLTQLLDILICYFL